MSKIHQISIPILRKYFVDNAEIIRKSYKSQIFGIFKIRRKLIFQKCFREKGTIEV